MTSKKKDNFFFITNNTMKQTPKKTEILNLFNTINTEKSRPKIYALPKVKKEKKNMITHNLEVPFFDDSQLFSDEQQTSKNKIKSLKGLINLSNVEQIKSIILPEIKANNYKDQIDSNFAKDMINSKIHSLAEDISRGKYTSQGFHELRQNILIEQVLEKNQKSIENLGKAVKEIKTKEILEEERDVCVFENLREIRLKQLIRNFLGAKDNKLNQVNIRIEHEKFFKILVNKVNFIEDGYQIPDFKNNFVNYRDKMDKLNEYRNIIDRGINIYLNIVRYALQRCKDDKKEMIEREIAKESRAEDEEDPNDKINFLRTKEKNKDKIFYEVTNFFVHKYVKYDKVRFADNKYRDIIYKLK